jgi:DNA invertase Pin-like site-specific DNA recombinase
MSKARKINLAEGSSDLDPYAGREGLPYVRVSSKRQENEGHGRESQEARCIKKLENLGVQYGRSFLDSYSGFGDFMDRPAMRELLFYIDSNPHKKFLVIFDDLSRFARDVQFHLKLRAAFRSRDVVLLCLNFNLDDSPEGMFAETVLAAGNELERHKNRRQVIQKQSARLLLGYWPFASRKPYKMVNHVLEAQYPEADFLKEAMEGFASGRFVRKIDACKFLVEKGYWKKQSPEKYIDKLTELFSDILFAGYIEYSDWGVSRREGKHKGLITLETHERIQKRMKSDGLNKRIRIDISEDFPQRGLTLCFHCRKPLTAAWTKGRNEKYPYYFCQNKGCEYKQKVIPRKDIAVGFDRLLKKQRLKEGVSVVLEKIFDAEWGDVVKEVKAKQAGEGEQKKKLEEKIRTLSDRAGETKIQAARDAYEKQIEEAALEMEGLSDDVLAGDDLSTPYRTALEKATGLLKSPYEVWNILDPKEQHQLFYFIFEQKIPYDINEGYRTDEIPTAVRLFEEFVSTNPLDVDTRRKTLNRLKDYLSRFWGYYNSSSSLQKALENLSPQAFVGAQAGY